MKIRVGSLFLLLVVIFSIFSEDAANNKNKIELKTQKEKISYSFGYDIGSRFIKANEIDIDYEIFLMAIKDGANAKNSLLTDEEMAEAVRILQQELAEKQQEKSKVLGEKNKIEGEAFLAENRKKEGVIVLPSGLQYKIILEGAGRLPKDTDKVTVHYKGIFIDGKEFDSSYSRNEPATFVLNQVIKGWTEGLQLLKEGGKIILYIPAELAYGEDGAGQVISPNSTLIFEIELLKVE